MYLISTSVEISSLRILILQPRLLRSSRGIEVSGEKFWNPNLKTIKKTITIIAIALLTLLSPSKLIAEDVFPEGVKKPERIYSKQEIVQLVDKYADKYDVSRDLAHYIVSKESTYNPKNLGDKHITCKRTGEPVNARGLMQITQCFHPNVTDEQAYDPEFNLNYGMKLASKKETCIQQFSTCRDYYRINN